MRLEQKEIIEQATKNQPSLQERHLRALAAVKRFDSDLDLPDGVRTQLSHLSPDIPNIAILYYGGTLGMVADENGKLVPTDDIDKLLQPLLLKDIGKEINPIWFRVTDKAIDSTNGRWVHWVTIGNAVRRLYADFDDVPGGINGFIVAGGTDTMAHLTAGLKYMMPNIGRPVITTGSQSPIFKPGTDAEANLYFSLGVAASDLSGVHQAFGNVLREGLHLHKVRDRNFNAFECPAGYQLGEFNSEGIVLFDNAPRRNRYVRGKDLEFYSDFREGVKVVRLSPTTPSDSILHDALDPSIQTLLLITYGAGNVRDEGLYPDEMTHIDALKVLRQAQFPVVLGSSMMDGVIESPYASGAKAVEALEKGGSEAISARNVTGAALEVKMMRALALACDSEGELDYFRFREEMYRNHVGELASRNR
jgi:L-asparaginase/Glu-tRNA(Gln) amidotransferase subunit D